MSEKAKNPEREWFGEKQVSATEKTALVRGVFDSVATKYDLMNDLMSGGMHRLWKDRLIRMIRPVPGMACLDVAGGTGDIAFRIRRATERARKTADEAPGQKTAITICDLNAEMLSVGRDRALDRGWIDDFDWVTGNAEALPFPDESFDLYTIAFGLRNVTHIDTALQEARRVLKPGGRFFCMEFSRVEEPMLARIYDAYSYHAIPAIGKAVADDRDSYQYLVESIRKFPRQKELCRRMEAAGLRRARHTDLSFGIVAIHQGWRL